MIRSRWHLAVPALLTILAACGDEPSTPDPVASLSVSPAQPVLMRGDTLRVAAVAYDASGKALGGRAVTWSSSAPDIVSVSATGLLTGVGRGAATITVTSEGLSVPVPVTVAAAPPAVTGFAISPAQVDVSTADATVEFSVTARVDAGMQMMSVHLESLRNGDINQQFHSCFTHVAPASGTSRAGAWKCSIVMPRGSISGAWKVKNVSVADSAGKGTGYSDAQLAAAGMPASIQVQNQNEDLTAPVVTSISVKPASVSLATGPQVVELTFTATDAGAGLRSGYVGLRPSAAGTSFGCGAPPVEGEGVRAGTFKCPITVPANTVAGTWKLSIDLLDRPHNLRMYNADQLKAAGFTSEVVITP
ncbi:Ig-like domain-containing protein [Longimicrobium sp.]|jgi:hypothetical protein|uniref:Ig-like domain-containing protein n=1 Tax=Longimicrobium sp. TaxID=2029185 RepID=UPI002F959799